MKKLEIVSDGTAKGTKVLVDGEALDRVMRVCWEINVERGFAMLTITQMAPDLIATSSIDFGSRAAPIPFILASKES